MTSRARAEKRGHDLRTIREGIAARLQSEHGVQCDGARYDGSHCRGGGSLCDGHCTVAYPEWAARKVAERAVYAARTQVEHDAAMVLLEQASEAERQAKADENRGVEQASG